MVTIAGEIRSDRLDVQRREQAAGRNDMKRFCAASVVMGTTLGVWACMAPAIAAPPTATPSPGYDARLQEQRAAQANPGPAMPASRPVSGHRIKRTRRGAR
jgi:hypothetical protein